MEREVTFNNEELSIDLSALQTGLYIVRVTGEDGNNYVTKITME
ncbi:T9SS type A sorting domain-containing protein [Flavobacterium longum]